jgi:hypothetical protein
MCVCMYTTLRVPPLLPWYEELLGTSCFWGSGVLLRGPGCGHRHGRTRVCPADGAAPRAALATVVKVAKWSRWSK